MTRLAALPLLQPLRGTARAAAQAARDRRASFEVSSFAYLLRQASAADPQPRPSYAG